MAVELLRWRLSGQARAVRGYGDDGAAGARRLRLRELRTAKEEREMKLRALGVAGGCWRVEGALRPALAALGRAPATRGHAPRHVAHKL